MSSWRFYKAKVMIAPGKYVQGAGEIENLGAYVVKLGKKALVLVSIPNGKKIEELINISFSKSGVEILYGDFNGECSRNEIARLVTIVKTNGIEVVVGVGGGKILDTAKAVACDSNLPVAIVPTIASTDAPCSALSVVYSDEGVFEEYYRLHSNPNLVLVDTDVIVKAPVRLLVAGMGDALATYFEARACEASKATSSAGGLSTLAAMCLAKKCYETLISEGELAKLAAEAHACTKALENIVEVNILLSGIGFESGGLAGAHAVHNGLTVLPQCRHMYHGEKVAFGTIVQLVLENAPEEELYEVFDFCVRVGLPVTLGELGITEIKEEDIMAVAKAAVDTIGNMPFTVTAKDIYAAILAADAIGKTMSEKKKWQ